MLLYNYLVKFFFFFVKFCEKIIPTKLFPYKVREFIELQVGWKEHFIQSDLISSSNQAIWFHMSSYGEYQIVRPIISWLKRHSNHNVVVTFFSPTGYNAVIDDQGKEGEPDFVLPLPIDTLENATSFLHLIKPCIAIFIVSEFWPNFIREVRKNGINLILYSAFVKSLNKWKLSTIFRKIMYSKFDKIIVHDQKSADNLEKIGISKIDILPDPLFDNILKRRQEKYSDLIIESFINGSQNIIVAGSVHLDNDLELIASLAERYPETKLIIVPHEISEERLNRILAIMPKSSILYSEVNQHENLSQMQSLIIDFIGYLPYIYRYGQAAYVGGGFTRLLHSVVEPLAYGIPVAFGPKISRKYLAYSMAECRVGTVVRSKKEICTWWQNILSQKHSVNRIKTFSKEIFRKNSEGGKIGAEVILKLL